MNSPYLPPKEDSLSPELARPAPTVFGVLAAIVTSCVFGCLSLGFIIFGAGAVIVATAGGSWIEILLGGILIVLGMCAAYSGWITAVNIYHWGRE